MKTSALTPEIATTLWFIKVMARVSLGLVWIYEGLVPKILFLNAHPEQTALVLRSGIYWSTPQATLVALGIAQIIMGVILVIGKAERLAVALATTGLVVLIVLVAMNNHSMLTDPFGALAKDLCLISCAATVWLLAPLRVIFAQRVCRPQAGCE